MKNILFKRFFISASVFILLFNISGCQVSISEKEDLSLTENSDEVNISLAFENTSRSALPQVDLEEISSVSLYYEDTEGLDSNSSENLCFLGSWESVAEMNDAVITFKTGTYDFTVIASSGYVIYSDTKNFTIKKGLNRLSFSPRMELITNNQNQGKGALKVSVSYDNENVALVTGGLYTLEGNKVQGYTDESLEIISGGKSVYAKEDIPAGSYILIFKFFADEEKTLLRGTYREYCSIINGKTSSSECVVESLAGLFSITFEMNGGAFANGVTFAGNYTRQSALIELPVNNESETKVLRSGYTFGGWYENSTFSGNPVTEIPCGSTGNKVFYAKWLENAVITFIPNATGATITTHSQTVIKGEEAALKTAADLGLSYTGGRFLGWAEESNATSASYTDGGAIIVSDNKNLYAVWSVSSINPSGPGDKTDTDGDGLTDWEEMNTYFTDPSSPDTDGDGWNDGIEVKGLYNKSKNVFNPLIADTPFLDLRIIGTPYIAYKYTLSDGSSSTVSASETAGTVGSQTTNTTNTKTHNQTHGWNAESSQSYTWVKGHEGFTLGFKEAYNGSVSNGDSYTYSKADSESWSKSWSNGKSSTSSSSKTVTGGSVSVFLRLKNPSSISYTVENLTVALYRISSNSKEGRSFVTNLELADAQVITIPAESESGDLKFSASIGIGLTELLMKYSRGFEIEVAGYKITLQKDGQYPNDFTEALTQVKAKTASVFIDWGNLSGRSPRTYNVSVKNNYNTEATSIDDLYEEPNLDEIFQNVLHFTKGTDYVLNTYGHIQKIYNFENQASNAQGAWFICHKYTSNGNRLASLYAPGTDDSWSLDKIKLNAGDEVFIIYSIDKDNDGVPLNEELIYGTSDENSDSDGDGLSDYEEIYGWYKADIGLDAKYSEGNKVYTNPSLIDSDGDDLPDYSEDSTKRDSDPTVPKMKDDASISVFKFAEFSEGDFTDFYYNSSKACYYIGPIDSSTIWLDIQPKLSFATVSYSTNQSGGFQNFDKTSAFKLNVGENIFYIRCTAPDGETTKDYKVTVDSTFKKMQNFKLTNKTYAGGSISLTWEKYSDARAEKDDGGYILYGKKGFVTKKLERSDITYASDSKSKLDEKDEFYLRLSKGELATGLYSLELKDKTEYTLILFAYAQSGSDESYKSEQLFSKQFKTALKKEATLKFYAHFIKGVNEHDGGSAGEYKWSFSETGGKLGLNDLTKSDLVSLEDKWCYGFKNRSVSISEPTKFGECTQEFSARYERGKNYSFTVKFEAWEDDNCDTDKLGTVTATFSYDSSADHWVCVRSASGGDGCHASEKKAAYIISAGSRSNNMEWPLCNSDYGEISFHCDFGWDE